MPPRELLRGHGGGPLPRGDVQPPFQRGQVHALPFFQRVRSGGPLCLLSVPRGLLLPHALHPHQVPAREHLHGGGTDGGAFLPRRLVLPRPPTGPSDMPKGVLLPRLWSFRGCAVLSWVHVHRDRADRAAFLPRRLVLRRPPSSPADVPTGFVLPYRRPVGGCAVFRRVQLHGDRAVRAASLPCWLVLRWRAAPCVSCGVVLPLNGPVGAPKLCCREAVPQRWAHCADGLQLRILLSQPPAAGGGVSCGVLLPLDGPVGPCDLLSWLPVPDNGADVADCV